LRQNRIQNQVNQAFFKLNSTPIQIGWGFGTLFFEQSRFGVGMRKVVASVILAAIIAGAITLLMAWKEDPVAHINQIIEWVLLWIRDENNRNLLTAITTIAGIIGWSWAVISWLWGRDTATRLELLHLENSGLHRRLEFVTKQLIQLPDILIRGLRDHDLRRLAIDTRTLHIGPYRLEARVLGTFSPEEQDNVFATIKHAIRLQERGDGVAYIPPRPAERRRLPIQDYPIQDAKREAGPPRASPRADHQLDSIEHLESNRSQSIDLDLVRPAAPEREPADPIRELLESSVQQILREAEKVA
jgi:hypothetical protein